MKSYCGIASVMVVCTAFSMCAQVPSVRSTRPPTDAAFMQSSRNDLIQSLHLRPLGSANDTERDIAGIIRALPTGLPTTPAVWICDGCGTSSHPELGIIVDTGQLERIRVQSKVQNFHAMLVFVVAHEAAHQLQFARYQKNLYALPLADRLCYEAQADLLAGIWLFNAAGMNFDVAGNNAIAQTLHVVYDLGVEQYAIADHPSHAGRFLAARTGLQLAFSRNAPAGIPMAAQNAASVRQQIGIQTGETDLAFSLRTARRITEYNPIAARDLVQNVTPHEVNWSKGADNPVVNYQLTYANRGIKALRVSLEVLCISAPRDDPDDLFHMLQASSKLHSFILQPGGQTVISGQLVWVAKADVYPRLVYPPDTLGLVEVHYVDGSDSRIDETKHTLSRLGVEPLPDVPTGQKNSYEYSFSAFLDASINNYADLRSGPGRHFNSGTDHYNSSTALPGAVDSELVITSQGKAHIISTLLRTTEAQAATERYTKAVALVRAGLAGIRVPRGIGSWQETSDKGDDANDDLTMLFSQGDYDVTVERWTDQEDNGQGVHPTFYYVEVTWSGEVHAP
jgi:hypothetical protein